jgi:hypothetical protein
MQTTQMDILFWNLTILPLPSQNFEDKRAFVKGCTSKVPWWKLKPSFLMRRFFITDKKNSTGRGIGSGRPQGRKEKKEATTNDIEQSLNAFLLSGSISLIVS